MVLNLAGWSLVAAFVAKIVDSFVRVLSCIVIVQDKTDGGSPSIVLLLKNFRIATRYALLTTLT